MEIGWWGVLIAVLGGAIRIGTPFLFVSLGECLTEKSGRINLGLEGTLVMGAMTGYAVSLHSGSPWLGVLCAGLAGMVARCPAQLALQLPTSQRYRRGDRDDALRHGVGLLSGKAVHPTLRTSIALHRPRRME